MKHSILIALLICFKLTPAQKNNYKELIRLNAEQVESKVND